MKNARGKQNYEGMEPSKKSMLLQKKQGILNYKREEQNNTKQWFSKKKKTY